MEVCLVSTTTPEGIRRGLEPSTFTANSRKTPALSLILELSGFVYSLFEFLFFLFTKTVFVYINIG